MRFLNVDLNLESRLPLEPLLNDLISERAYVLHSESRPNKHFANLETNRNFRKATPDRVINALCDALDRLSSNARKIWNQARIKTFNVGLELDPKQTSGSAIVSNDSLQRIASLGATITITCYHFCHSPDAKLPAPKRKSRAQP